FKFCSPLEFSQIPDQPGWRGSGLFLLVHKTRFRKDKTPYPPIADATACFCMKLDILVFTAHPDDAELGCSGTLAKHIAAGKKAGIIDLTRGELGTRGSAELRDEEAADAAKVLGLHVRENLAMRDGFF